MAVRRVKRGLSVSAGALRLEAALRTNTRVTAASDPLKLRRDAVDRELRELRARHKTFVEAID
ncbi:hypothetical protein M2344_002253 [Sphingobium sp. B8D3C]|nr:hypothetical protein [Sphingobium sp. B8D3B]MCW2419291.1 hypothetical protein [Sphingobium sp. B8D3C]